jgi:enoyl-CoA hydratase/carnithine racemase
MAQLRAADDDVHWADADSLRLLQFLAGEARDQLMAEAAELANRICELSPVAVQGMKELMVRGTTLDHHAINQVTEEIQNRVMSSEDRREGVKAFAGRRKLDWPGR